MIQTMCDLFRRFRRDETGASIIEAVIITPVLIWAYIASFVFYDGFRTYSTSVKATYAIADVISRQKTSLTPFDMEGFATIFATMVRDSGNTRMRMTQIHYDANTDMMHVDWSYATNGEARLFTANLNDFVGLLPDMTHAERLILVESFVPYTAAFNLGTAPVTFSNFTVTRPRSGQVPFSG
jgi:Flp pilus assembly protein TadG